MAAVTLKQLSELFETLGGDTSGEEVQRLIDNGDFLRALAQGTITRGLITPLLATVQFCGLELHYGARSFNELVAAERWEERSEWYVRLPSGQLVPMSEYIQPFTQEVLRRHWARGHMTWRFRATSPCGCPDAA